MGSLKDSKTVLLLHCDGTDASTSFPDASLSGHTVTAAGNAQVDTAQSKFGGASALFDGTGDYLTTADSADWNFGAGDFTIDFWLRFNAHSSNGGFIQVYGTGSDYAWALTWQSSGNIRFMYTTSGTPWTNNWAFAWSPLDSTWYHVALVRNGTDIMVFVDGTQIGSTQTIGSDSIHDSSQPVDIGADARTDYLNGWLDEIRVSKGVARWTANFTPPSAPYQPDVAGSVTPSGVPVWMFGKPLAGSVTPSGALVAKLQYLKSLVGSVTPSGALSTAQTIYRTLSGTVTPAGSLSRIKKFVLGLTAASTDSLTLSGASSDSLTLSDPGKV